MSDDPQRDSRLDSVPDAPLTPPPLPVSVVPLAMPALPPPLPARSRGRWVVVAVTLLVALLAVGVWTAVRMQLASAARRAALNAETAEQKYREARGAFAAGTAAGAPDALDVDPAEHAAIEAAFARLSAAVRNDDSPAVAAMIDSERMTVELEGLPGFPKMTRAERRQMPGALTARFSQNLANDLSILGWTRHRFGRVKRLGPDDAVAYVRHWNDENVASNLRWWFHKGAGGWRVYDYEELHTGNRVSHIISIVFSGIGAGGVPPPWLASAKNMKTVHQALAGGDVDAAEKELAAMEGQSFPAAIDATRLLAKAIVQISREDYRGALASLDRAAALKPDSPAPDMLRAQAHYWLGEHEKAVHFADRYYAVLGPDSENLITKGSALEALGRFDEAAGAYRAALDDDPDAAGHLAALALVATDKSGQADVAERFKRSSRSLALFNSVAVGMQDHEDGTYDETALAAVVSAFRERLGKADIGPSGYADVVEAELHARAGRHGRAAALSREALLLNVPDAGTNPEFDAESATNLRERLRGQYLASMYALKKSIEAYRTAQDRAEAFQSLAGMHNAEGDADGLLRLAAARQADAPGDPWAQIYEGHAHTTQKAFEKAETAYAAAAGKVKAAKDFDDNARVLLRYFQLRSRYNLRRSASALVDLPPAWDAFRQLATLHAEDGDADGLAKLVAAYRAKRPGDASIGRWEAELKWLGQDYAAAADLYLAFRKRRDAESPPGWESEPPRAGLPGSTPEPDPSYVEDRLIDSLLRSGRGAEAIELAERSRREHEAHYDLLWVHAFLGNVPEATAAFEAMAKQQGRPPLHFYDTEELGPLLRGEKFAALRAAYPPLPEAATQPTAE